MKPQMARPELGVCYYPEHWEQSRWEEDARQMVGAGLTWVRIGEFTWGLTELGRNRFDWAWLDSALDVLGDAGLKVMFSTPTAVPPNWLVREFPEILPVDRAGRTRTSGSRRHYCLSSEKYVEEAKRITKEYVGRYGKHRAVQAWQIDNEIGDHDTAISYSAAALSGFRRWLQGRYTDIDTLNRSWNTKFWGGRFGDFDEIQLPVGSVTAPSPALELEFMRYSSGRVARFIGMQSGIIRKHSPGRPVIHNFMAGSYDFDHRRAAAHLDIAGFDSYPLGNLIEGHLSIDEKASWLRIGAPDYQGFHCDMYRELGQCGMWVVEQQPGPVNWASYNPAPVDGAVRLWIWMAYAHGADTVLYFRWRQVPFGQEQFHSALCHYDGTPDRARHEIAKVATERVRIPPTSRSRAKIALVVDYESRWAQRIHPHGLEYSGEFIAADWYRCCRELGNDVDIVGPETELLCYRLVLVPDMVISRDGFVSRLLDSQAQVVLGARCGSFDSLMQSPPGGAPGAFRRLIDVTVRRVESLPPWHREAVEFGDREYSVTGWREHVESDEPVMARFSGGFRGGAPAVLANVRTTYLAITPRGECLRRVLVDAMTRAGLPVTPAPEGIRVTFRGNIGFAFNFSGSPGMVPERPSQRFLIGARRVEPAGLSIWIEEDP